MECEVAREALSARIDGEREPVPSARVDEHVATCENCRRWYEAASDLALRLRDRAAAASPQIASVPTATARVVVRRSRRRWARWALAVVGAAQMALAIAQGFGGNVGLAAHHAGAGTHLLNESTAWSAALGVVMIVAALRPSTAAGLAGVLAVFTTVLAAYVIADALAGAVTPLRIATHVPIVLGTALVFMVWRASQSPPQRPDTNESPAITLPPDASRGRRRGHLRPTSGSAA